MKDLGLDGSDTVFKCPFCDEDYLLPHDSEDCPVCMYEALEVKNETHISLMG